LGTTSVVPNPKITGSRRFQGSNSTIRVVEFCARKPAVSDETQCAPFLGRQFDDVLDIMTHAAT